MRLKAAAWCIALLFGVLLTCLLVAPVPSASAAGPYSFDAKLSLMGDCSTPKVDPVPDPGCPEGTHPPSGAFSSPRSVVTDFYGDIFVASWGEDAAEGAEGRIDIFDPEGRFLTEIPDPAGPRNLAVDSKGNLYVFDYLSTGGKLVRYSPKAYDPPTGKVEYESTPTLIENIPWFFAGMAINPENDRLFVYRLTWIGEYGSAEEGNALLGKIGEGVVSGNSQGLAVDAAHDRLYASDENVPGTNVIDVFELGGEHKALEPIDGSDTPPGVFSNFITFAANEGTGELSVYDGENTNVVYQLAEDGSYIETIEHSFEYVYGAEIGVDNGPFSPNNGYLFVPSHPTNKGHSFAFGPPPSIFPPKVKAIDFAEVSENDAELLAEIETGNLETTYTFELEAEGAGGPAVAGEGSIPAGEAPVPVAVQVEGLEPGTAYRFWVVVTNKEGSDETEDTFATYREEPLEGNCLNAPLRTGPSALLPDCRAYELVTPPDTNGRTPLGVGYLGLGTYFTTRHASPQGNAVTFEIEGGSIPGFEATGSYAGDPYLATRGEDGWKTTYAGPSGEESPALLPGSNSPDQGYSFWSTGSGEGSASVEEEVTRYVRYPDGHSALIGRGSIAQDSHAVGKLISEGGGHIIFTSSNVPGEEAIQLEENAPPNGTHAIYDRTSDEVTHVVSLLPEGETPSAGENAVYQGASLDGKGIAFKLGPGSPLYLRYNNEETYEAAGAGATFAGVAEGGKRVFYLEGGNFYAYEVGGEENPISFSTTSDVTPVNVAADGTVAYFVSPTVLTAEPNPEGDLPIGGQQNLYRSEEGLVSFVGTVTERDVKGENSGNGSLDGLGLWTTAVGPGSSEKSGQLAKDPSRTTPDGQALLFSSRAALGSYDPEGHPEVYRYDFAGNELDCLSCNPTLAKATGEASLQSVAREQGAPEPFGPFAYVTNLRADGRRAFFQSTEALVAGDTDKLQDVYEWEAQGVGSCQREGGCVYLISSGHSHAVDYLWAVSDSGDNAFFRSSDLLVGSDTDTTPSIYDARVGGGFPEPPPPPICQEANCQPASTPPPELPIPRTPVLGGEENVPPAVRCPKGKRKVVRNDKTHCVKKLKKHRHHRKAGTKRKGAGR